MQDRFKMAFSTLGCPNWNMTTIISKAKEYGYNGVDFRGYLGEMDIFNLPEFSTQADETLGLFKDANLEVPCFSSSVSISYDISSGKTEKNLNEIKSYCQLCNIFKARYIRIFAGYFNDMPKEQAVEIAAMEIEKMVKIAEDYNVILLIETHDDWLDCFLLKMLMERVDSQSVGILWDTHHPYRLISEKPEITWQTIGKWIKYTHWKDSCIDKSFQAGHRPCLTGEGDIPLKDIYSILKDSDYSGYFTLEWEKMWIPEIEEPEIAFPVFAQFMKQLTVS